MEKLLTMCSMGSSIPRPRHNKTPTPPPTTMDEYETADLFEGTNCKDKTSSPDFGKMEEISQPVLSTASIIPI